VGFKPYIFFTQHFIYQLLGQLGTGEPILESKGYFWVKFKLGNVKFFEFLELSMSVSLVYSIIPQKCFAVSLFILIVVPSDKTGDEFEKHKCIKGLVINILSLHA
jgi:hypothetical protein